MWIYWERIVDYIVYSAMGLEKNALSGALHFFIYDTVKIFLLLSVIIFIVSFLRTYITPEKTRRILGGKNVFLGTILASILGIFTPFCSCSAIPLFIGFVEAGVPLGVTFSFLVASPMINEIAVGLLLSTFGAKVMVMYIGTGLLIAIISGNIISYLKLEKYVEDFVYKTKVGAGMPETGYTMGGRIQYGLNYTGEIIKKVWYYILIAIGIGGFMHGFAPAGVLSKWVGAGNIFAVPLAVIVGVPLYANAAGIIPIVKELTRLGVQTGTALAFMMAVTALSLPEFIILKKVLKIRLLLTYFGIISAGIIFVGYLFNYIMK
ncbi:permease [Candidatus Dependentiae bacterium]|nr:permease [Candidatus Dependentiae bacterium]